MPSPTRSEQQEARGGVEREESGLGAGNSSSKERGE